MNVEKSRMAVKGIRHLFYGFVFLFAVKLYESYSLLSHYTQSEALGKDISLVYGDSVWMHSLFYFFLVHTALVMLLALFLALVFPIINSRKEIPGTSWFSLPLLAVSPVVYLSLVAFFFLTSPYTYGLIVFGPLNGWTYVDSLLLLPPMAGAMVFLREHSSVKGMVILATFPVLASLFGLCVAIASHMQLLERIQRTYLVMFFNLAMLIAAVGFSTVGNPADVRLDRLEAGIDKIQPADGK